MKGVPVVRASLHQSATHWSGVVSNPAYMAGFSSIPLAAITPSTPVAATVFSTSFIDLTSPLAMTGMVRDSLIVLMASKQTGSPFMSLVLP